MTKSVKCIEYILVRVGAVKSIDKESKVGGSM